MVNKLCSLSGLSLLAALGSLAGISSASAAILYPANNGFEVPDFQGTGYATNNPPTGPTSPDAYDYGISSSVASWTFVGGTGIANNQSGFGVSGADNGNSDGTQSKYGQAAFIQGGNGTTGGSSFSQTISGFADGSASVSFKLEYRHDDPATSNPITVMLDSQNLGTYSQPLYSFVTETTPTVTVTAGSHTLYFIGAPTSGNPTEFVDTVSITNLAATPEPASLGLLTVGALGLLAGRRRKA